MANHRLYLSFILVMCCSIFATAAVKSPKIESSSGTTLLPGVSTITITAENGCKIWYNINGEAPTTTNYHEICNNSVLVIDNFDNITAWPKVEVTAVAVDGNGNLSQVSAVNFVGIEKKYTGLSDFYNRWSKNKTIVNSGIVAGPLTIVAAGQVLDSGRNNPNWVILHDERVDVTDPNLKDRNSIIVEMPSGQGIPDCMQVGRVIDYIDIKYDLYNSSKGVYWPSYNYMNFSTYNGGPTNSKRTVIPYHEIEIEMEDSWGVYPYLLPFVLRNVEVTDRTLYWRTICEKFQDFHYDFEEEHKYDIYGLIGCENGTDVIFVTDVVDLSEPKTVTVSNIEDAFEGDGETAVVFDCKLTVIAMNMDRTHLFVKDENGNHMTIVGDLSTASLNMGDVIYGLTAVASYENDMRYAKVTEEINKHSDGEQPVPVIISADEITDNIGCYVKMETTLEIASSAEITSRSAAMPEIKVGGVKVNPNAIDENVANSFATAAETNDSSKKYNLEGVVALDKDVQPEFWPTLLEETSNGDVTTSIIDIEDNDAPVKMFDLYGREVEPANASPGVYVVKKGNSTNKLIIRP